MNQYYEIPGDPPEYYVKHDVRLSYYNPRLTAQASRIWGEIPDGRVAFIKNRTVDLYDTNGIMTAVDMDEFFWVKLRSKLV
jgi:hypothetical protein